MNKYIARMNFKQLKNKETWNKKWEIQKSREEDDLNRAAEDNTDKF